MILATVPSKQITQHRSIQDLAFADLNDGKYKTGQKLKLKPVISIHLNSFIRGIISIERHSKKEPKAALGVIDHDR